MKFKIICYINFTLWCRRFYSRKLCLILGWFLVFLLQTMTKINYSILKGISVNQPQKFITLYGYLAIILFPCSCMPGFCIFIRSNCCEFPCISDKICWFKILHGFVEPVNDFIGIKTDVFIVYWLNFIPVGDPTQIILNSVRPVFNSCSFRLITSPVFCSGQSLNILCSSLKGDSHSGRSVLFFL